jgi:hypothetical protein
VVKLPLGQVSEKDWIEALSDRVNELALREKNPEKAANQACLKLDVVQPNQLNQLGQSLVSANSVLLTYLNVAILDKNPFPSVVKEANEELEQMYKEVDLNLWVDLALSQVHESSLD